MFEKSERDVKHGERPKQRKFQEVIIDINADEIQIRQEPGPQPYDKSGSKHMTKERDQLEKQVKRFSVSPYLLETPGYGFNNLDVHD